MRFNPRFKMFKRNSWSTAAVALVLLGTALGCSAKRLPSSTTTPSADIFSDRPIQDVPDVYVVTLTAPALTVAGQKTSAGWVIPDSAKSTLLQEQAAFEKKVLEISPGAQFLYHYRLVINGIALYAPSSAVAQIAALPMVKNLQPSQTFARPQAEVTLAAKSKVEDVTSVSFIGAESAHQLGYRGQGLRIGVIDTGIDYTHKMLGGSGVAADYKANDPSQPNAAFPNKKVVGGIDLVGSDFNAASPLPSAHMPHPDGNPLDEAGHGTHVAGTIAGMGDGVNSYSGVAPEAALFAIKVFGKAGSTMDAAVIAALEYAADPNGDLNPDDQLDVVNLSLGGGFGQPHILYTEAVRNLSQAGTLVVAAAGNSGPVDYIVGAPSTADDALSVAASIDGSPHNWQFPAVRFVTSSNPNWLVASTEGPVSKPIANAGSVSGELVDIGLADTDLTDDVKQKLNGKVALIQRGKVPFLDKLKRAVSGGAVGAVVYNSDATKPFAMGSTNNETVEIPATMISQAVGLKLLDEMKLGPVTIDFQTTEKVLQPELVDSITDFSSKGPRSEDNLLKPEIAAPGYHILSAAMGQGDQTVQMDGTSMASPHMTGVMALIKQAHPGLSSAELKALAMDSSKILLNVPITLQGAGRVQVDRAIQARILVSPASLSLGRIQVADSRQEVRKIKIKNISAQDVDLSTKAISGPGLKLSLPETLHLPAQSESEITITATIDLPDGSDFISELDGRVLFNMGDETLAQIPALAIRTQESTVQAAGTPTSIALSNSSPVPGLAMAFNLLGERGPKPAPALGQSWKGHSCDLQSVGYRLLHKPDANGQLQEVAQFAFKLYTPVTTWIGCDLSLLIDVDGDGVPDQELAGVSSASVAGLSPAPFFTVLLDAKKARSLRVDYETALGQGQQPKLDFSPAVLASGPMAPFPQSTVAVIEVPLAALGLGSDGNLHVKAASVGDSNSVVQADDFLGDSTLGDWLTIPATFASQPYSGMAQGSVVTKAGTNVELTAGSTSGKLVLYYPLNPLSSSGADTQEQILTP